MKWPVRGAALVLFAMGTLYGMRADLPDTRVSTELEQVQRAVRFGGTRDLNPRYFLHPPLFAYLLLIIYAAMFVAVRLMGWVHDATSYERLFFTDPTAFLLAGRVFTFGLGLVSLLLSYRLARRLFSESVASWTVLLLAISPVVITWSHYASADIATLFVSLWALLAVVKLVETGSWSSYLIAGLWIGLSAAMKYQAILLGPTLLVAHLLRGKRDGLTGREGLGAIKWWASCIAVIVGFILGCPYAALDPHTFFTSFMEMARRAHAEDYQFLSWKADRPSWLYIWTTVLPFSLGAPLTALCLAGLVYSACRRRQADTFLLAAILPFLLVMSRWTMIKPRYFLPVIPLMVMAGAQLMLRCLEFIPRPRTMGYVLAGAVVLLPALWQSWRFDRQIATLPVTTQAKRWIETHVPPGTAIAAFPGVPLNPNPEAIKRQLARVQSHGNEGVRLSRLLRYAEDFPKTYDLYELPFPWRDDFDSHDFDLPKLRQAGVEYVIVTTHVRDYLSNPSLYSTQVSFFKDVQHSCQLAKRFQGDKPLIDVGFPYEEEVQVYCCRPETEVHRPLRETS